MFQNPASDFKTKLESLIALGLLCLAAFSATCIHPPVAHAQFSGQSTYVTSGVIAYQTTSPNVIVPVCAPPITTNCIANRGQLSTTVTYVWGTGCTSGATGSVLELEGSNDNKTYYITAASLPASTSAAVSGTFYENGAYNYYRLAATPCVSATPTGSLTWQLVGYGAMLPLNPLTVNLNGNIGANTVVLALPAPIVLQGMSCFNPNASVAWFQVSNTTYFYFQVGIAAGATFVYDGPPMLIPVGSANLTAQSTTTNGGSTGTATALNCNFAYNPSGPYYPFNPVSAF